MKVQIIALLVLVLTIAANATNYIPLRQAVKGQATNNLDPVNADTWKDILFAFLDGADVDVLVANSTLCISNSINMVNNIEEAVLHIVTRGWDWDNWLDFTSSVGTITPFVRTCYDVTYSSIHLGTDYVDSFSSFIDFANQAKNNAMMHIFDWYDVMAKVNDAIAKKKNKDLAFQIGRAITLLLVFPPKSTDVYASEYTELALPDLRPYEDFLKGFINGTQVFGSKSVKSCVNETEFMVKSIEDAQVQFNKKTDEGTRMGVFELADMFEHFRPLNEQCYNGVADVQAIIKKYINTFTSLIDIAINAARHFNQIYGDILGCYQNWRNKKYYEAGKNAGDVFYNVFFTK